MFGLFHSTLFFLLALKFTKVIPAPYKDVHVINGPSTYLSWLDAPDKMIFNVGHKGVNGRQRLLLNKVTSAEEKYLLKEEAFPLRIFSVEEKGSVWSLFNRKCEWGN